MLDAMGHLGFRASPLHALMRGILRIKLHETGTHEIGPRDASTHEATGYETSPLEANPRVTSADENDSSLDDPGFLLMSHLLTRRLELTPHGFCIWH